MKTIYTVGKKAKHRKGGVYETAIDAFRAREQFIEAGELNYHTRIWSWAVDAKGRWSEPMELPEMEHVPPVPEELMPPPRTEFIEKRPDQSAPFMAYQQAFWNPDLAAIAGTFQGLLHRAIEAEKRAQAAESKAATFEADAALWLQRYEELADADKRAAAVAGWKADPVVQDLPETPPPVTAADELLREFDQRMAAARRDFEAKLQMLTPDPRPALRLVPPPHMPLLDPLLHDINQNLNREA